LALPETHWNDNYRESGSVGQPKDGDPSAAYAVWEEGEVKLRRIARTTLEFLGHSVYMGAT
jgi:hypothetical protein